MIGIFGGTFDPIHFGHLRPLWDVKEALSFDELRLVPSYVPPHRDAPGATPEQRLAMLQLAVADVPEFAIDRREIERGGPSYMVDTLQSLRDEVGAAASLSLILGQDAFNGLSGWYQWQRLIELANIVVMHRPGNCLPKGGEVAELFHSRKVDAPERLQKSPSGRIFVQKVTQLEISATQIRTILAKNGDVRFLLPEPVRQYIAQQRLYR